MSLDIKDERTASRQLIACLFPRNSIYPLHYPVSRDALNTSELPGNRRNSPLHRGAEGCAKRVSDDPNYGIGNRRKRKAPKGGPEKRRRRYQITAAGIWWNDQTIANEYRSCRAAEAAAEKEIHASVVRRFQPRDAVATGNNRVIVQLPLERDFLCSLGEREGRKRGVLRCDSGQCVNPRCAAQSEHRERRTNN